MSTETFSNKSFNVWALKNKRRCSAKSTQSIKICFTVSGAWHGMHCGWSSFLRRYEFVKWVWPIRQRERTTSSLRTDLFPWCHSPKVGFISRSLLNEALFHVDCHFDRIYVFKFGLKSVKGSLILDSCKDWACFADISASSFPLIPIWLGIQQKTIDFVNESVCNLRS